jgi:solute carrier family 5 (sodium-dependent multivitamin transporter), member 6
MSGAGVAVEMGAKGMTAVDYVVLVGLLCSSLGIGVYYALCRKHTSTADYLVGGRSMPLVPTAISLLASYISAILILGQFYFSRVVCAFLS